MTYGYDITYTDFWGNRITCGVCGCETLEQAKQEALELAKMAGWTPPRWWQWWRRKDTRFGS